ncbi:kunitz-type serine protease inhibitor textilinin-3-like [Oppia nitens]|uniref:kunitz-type serine protease inhibitor textilinin-3-like n=1 Tax=Oppia nitens TaxID=1686743 RepID=UPI0023DA99C4|nr:kunitz-type serine protease inhibitor textilinin-3-like [Oppia nitens]
MDNMSVLLFTILLNICTVSLTIQQMCELVPDTGCGNLDIIRIYYNPILQQCLPFSWSGSGGNANRFVSIKSCYEICHPADPGIRRITATGIRPYFVSRKPPKYCNGKIPEIPELGVPIMTLSTKSQTTTTPSNEKLSAG